ncbi:single-stranded-DNA-specific exonuclease RecJ [Oceanospirillum linum]|uniref:Single-stranded-DNA-specific exonuclease RecJ n=1 Tax=Oceanospirillum linum TaxID=966 RepID=A0A1T1HFY7_OCELI|nr:single-stranded-DNA-specific exonuclease RecJ [Oceanospirillum linum]OOV88769.1 single-stranded-DNA-specific exonuclease RecJ [Oceanospirillum linum]SEG00431.1 exonuclease RecJ [Oleiphilus messinensis]SMP22238.1 exonuclease RecJ [Oceanospirillum linum]
MSRPIFQPRALNPAVLDQARKMELDPLLATIIAGRVKGDTFNLDGIVTPALKHIPPPTLLKDCEKAAVRIAQAVSRGERIGVLTDYDVDGITSHVVLYRALTELFAVPPDNIHSLIGHRINDGYGVSAGLISRILDQDILPDVIITADCGSSDEPRLVLLKQAGIDVIVTDHHALPEEGAPASAYAVVNPTQHDCGYPDATIAGCMVSWLVMAQVRDQLVRQGKVRKEVPKLGFLLSYVALGTVADCVSLGESAVNRAVVHAGLKLINRFDLPCWRAIRKLLRKETEFFDAGTLGFQLGPRINARGRLDDPYAALHYMLSPTDHQAEHYLAILDQDNEDRKAIEQEMTQDAYRMVEDQLARNYQGLSVFLEHGHAGVQGIVASRITQKTGKPSIVICPALNPDHLSGSARSVDGIHIRDILQQVHDWDKELLVKFGGHRGAAGLTLNKSRLKEFSEVFNAAVEAALNNLTLQPVVKIDSVLQIEAITEKKWATLQQLQPFGREFEVPCFSSIFLVEELRVVGADQSHLQLLLSDPKKNISVKGIWFKALSGGQTIDFKEGDQINLAYQLDINEFRGRRSIQLIVEYAYREN